MTLVRLVVDWPWEDDYHLFKQTPNCDGKWDDIQFTMQPVRECDYLIVYNKVLNDIKVICPTGNKWLISGEPPTSQFLNYAKSYQSFDKLFLQHMQVDNPERVVLTQGALPWYFMKNYRFLHNLTPGDKKGISFITSNKRFLPGHNQRLSFLNFIKNSNIKVEIYGRGIREVVDKFDALYPYQYSLAIENTVAPFYWTEKIADCFLSWTMPIYYGAPNIYDFFPPESMILIDINKPEEALDTIAKAITNNSWEKNLDAIKYARELVLDKYQMFPFFHEKIQADLQKKAPASKETFKIIAYNDTSLPKKIKYSTKVIRKIKKFLK